MNLDFLQGTLDPRITFTRSTTATRFNASGALETVAINTPRFDYNPVTLVRRGLLIEEARTNSIRNSTMQGAAAGTPGTQPTNWTAPASVSGLTYEIVGTGTESGIAYIDIRVSGTGTAGVVYDVFLASFESTTGVAAANGQTWTLSSSVRVVGGSLANITNVQLRLSERTSGGGNLVDGRTNIVPTSASLASQRFSYTRTNTNASTAYILPSILFTQPNGVPIDVTLRIGAPQLEQGAFATSYIPTTSAAVTRQADVASMTGTNFSSWFNATEGTFVVEGSCANFANSPIFLMPHDGTSSNYMNSPIVTSTGYARIAGVVSGVAWTNASTANNSAANATMKIAAAYKASDQAVCMNAGGVVSAANASIPSVNQMSLGNWRSGTGNAINGYIRKIAFYPTRLANSDLVSLTA